MTLKELSQLYYLNKEIEMDQQRLDELKAKASACRGIKLAGLPDCEYENKISELEKIISEKIVMCIQERDKLERYIADIPDSLTRQAFTLRFINGLNWVQVALKVGGGNTEDSVKKICYRYIKNKSCPFCPADM